MHAWFDLALAVLTAVLNVNAVNTYHRDLQILTPKVQNRLQKMFLTIFYSHHVLITFLTCFSIFPAF